MCEADDGPPRIIDQTGYRNAIALSSFGQKVMTGKPACGPVDVLRSIDLASGPLTLAALRGSDLGTATITVLEPSNKGLERMLYKVTLKNVRVASVSNDTVRSPTELTEDVTLTTTAFSLEYYPTTGSPMTYNLECSTGTIT